MGDKIQRHMDSHEHGRVEDPQPSHASGQEMEREIDSGIWGPGLFATKSQMIGGMAGTVIGGVLGGLIGLVLGLAFFYGDPFTVAITVIVGVVAGATALGTAGGFVFNRGHQERGEPDI